MNRKIVAQEINVLQLRQQVRALEQKVDFYQKACQALREELRESREMNAEVEAWEQSVKQNPPRRVV